MLSANLEQQMMKWTIKPNQSGEEACESLVIAEFDLDDSSGQSKLYPIDLSVPSILRLKVTATPACLCDPGGELGPRPPFQRITSAIKRAYHRLFPSKNLQSLY
jgi:hypothetical protein